MVTVLSGWPPVFTMHQNSRSARDLEASGDYFSVYYSDFQLSWTLARYSIYKGSSKSFRTFIFSLEMVITWEVVIGHVWGCHVTVWQASWPCSLVQVMSFVFEILNKKSLKKVRKFFEEPSYIVTMIQAGPMKIYKNIPCLEFFFKIVHINWIDM